MKRPFEGTQRIVLHGSNWEMASHLALDFGPGTRPLRFLHLLKKGLRPACWPSAAHVDKPPVQVSLGFSRHGLERAAVPRHVLACFALKAPAFWAGAALRADRHLGARAGQAATSSSFFDFMTLDAVLSMHAMDQHALQMANENVKAAAEEAGVRISAALSAQRLPGSTAPARQEPNVQTVHFGYRDAVSRIGIKDWHCAEKLRPLKSESIRAAGEFVLGHAQDSGANPWIAGPGLQVWPEALRHFFRNSSFGVLHQVEQDVAGFEHFVRKQAKATGLDDDEIKGKLCGRYPDGRSMAAANARAEDDFDYADDSKGHGCPFGSHARRMNPRGDSLAHSGRARALLRRGMPYGPPWAGTDDDVKRGLIGQFFCASIEDQFEHLLGQWADRVPLGSEDGGGARDPLIGAHQSDDGPFEIPRADGTPLRLRGLRPFTHALGTAYLFYPSLQTLGGIADGGLWGAANKETR